MASVASQLIEEVTAHAREICADGTYFPNNLRTTKRVNAFERRITLPSRSGANLAASTPCRLRLGSNMVTSEQTIFNTQCLGMFMMYFFSFFYFIVRSYDPYKNWILNLSSR